MIKNILTVVLIGISLTFIGCTKTTNAPAPTAVEILSIDSKLANDQLKEELSKAKESAKGWRENAQFIAILIKVTAEMKAEATTKTFVFGSGDDTNNWWTYSISGETGNIVRSLTPKEDFLGTNFAPIKEDYWQGSYIDALQIAENAGGTAFRANNLDSQINILLAQTDPKGWLWWQVEYIAGLERIKILVNPTDNKVYDENGELLTK